MMNDHDQQSDRHGQSPFTPETDPSVTAWQTQEQQRTPPPPPPGASATLRTPPPPRPRSSFLSVLLVLFVLFIFFVVAAGAGLTLLWWKMGGALPENVIVSGRRGETIGLLRIEGVIMPGQETQFLLDSLRRMADSESIAGIVLRIDSPGGSVGASQELYDMVEYARETRKKPVFVSMGDLAASGGYYIASAAHRIYSLKGTLTGSIGVVMQKPDLSGLAETLGIDVETIASGRFKDAGIATRELSPEAREMFALQIMDTHGQFLDDVMAWREEQLTEAARRLTPAQWDRYGFGRSIPQSPCAYLELIADGRSYTGRQALELGLVDEIGSLHDTIKAMADYLGFDRTPAVHEPVRRKTLMDVLNVRMESLLPSAQAPLQYRMAYP